MNLLRARAWLHLSRCALTHWLSDQASSIGAALAFYCAFSFAPLLVILVSVVSWLVGTDRAYGYIDSQLTSLFGVNTTSILLSAMKSSQKGSGLLATIVSVVTLLIGATSVFSALQTALQQIFGTQQQDSSGLWSILRNRVLSFGLILAIGFLLLVSLTISTAIAALRKHLATTATSWLVIMSSADLLISFILITILISLIYKFLPTPQLPWRHVIVGAVITALLFQVGRWGAGLYLAHATVPSAFGAAASFAALLLWLYYTAQIFLLGAEFTACLSNKRQIH